LESQRSRRRTPEPRVFYASCGARSWACSARSTVSRASPSWWSRTRSSSWPTARATSSWSREHWARAPAWSAGGPAPQPPW